MLPSSKQQGASTLPSPPPIALAAASRVTFSPVSDTDFDDLVALRIAAMRDSLERIGRYDPERARERLRASFWPQHTRFILVMGQRAGFYTFRPAADGFHLDHLYIHPSFQSQGIGSLVLRLLLSQADAGQRPVHVGALRDSRSNQFYQRHDFVQTSEDEWDIYYSRAARVSGREDMELSILIDDLSSPKIALFLEEHTREMKAVSPPGSNHALDLEGLKKPEITFWTVWDKATLIGCGAIKELDAEHAEVKSMRVAASYRGKGVASKLLQHIVREAKRRGYRRLSLETGSMPHFDPARSLYEKFGFQLCAPFSTYQEDANSVFMTKELEAP